jgi:acetyl/propionyl-CoA carboxylase alpha subunit
MNRPSGAVTVETIERRDHDLTARVRVDGVDEPIVVERLAEGRYRVQIAERRFDVALARGAAADWGAVDGQTFRWPHVTGEEDQVADTDGPLAASTPATVTAVKVAAGDHVAAGDTMVVLEAMKMEIPLRAPRAGRVARVGCAVGEQVQPGVALVELAPPPAEAT